MRSRSRIVSRLTEFAARILSHRCIFIMGCQRSGTTLLFMMLTSHPRVAGRNEDEAEYNLPRPGEILSNLLAGRRTCYKAIVHVGKLSTIRRRFPHAKLVWIVRHPYAVISSMRQLKAGPTRTWLDRYSAAELTDLSRLFGEIRRLDTGTLDPVSMGSYVWKYKALAINRYRTSGFSQIVVRFEDLLTDPEGTLKHVLSHVGLRWDEAVLQHHRHHARKRYVGNNAGDRPIDVRVLEKTDTLDDEDKATITSICSLEMSRCDYA